MADTAKIAKLLKLVAQGVAAHDRENPDHNTWGIGMAYFDIERLGLEEGEELLPGIVLQGDGGMTGQFRILCDGQHGEGAEEEEEELIEAVSTQEIAEPVHAEPVHAPGPAPPVKPPL
jgi:hypothetical protein